MSVYPKIGNFRHAIWHLWPFFSSLQNFTLLWSQWNRCRRSIELYYSAPSGCVSSPRSWRWHVWQAQQSEKNDLKMLSVLLSVLLLGPITIIRLTDEFPSICGQLGLTATDPSKSQKERTRMLGLVVVSCVVVWYSSRLVRGWNEMSKGQISWFLLCFFSFSLVVLIVIGIYLVPDKGLLVIHYFVSLLSLWLTHIFLWFMDLGKFATDIYWIFLYPSSLQASRKKGGKQAGRKKKDFGQLFTEKRGSMSAQKQCVMIFAKCQVDVFFVRIETSSHSA